MIEDIVIYSIYRTWIILYWWIYYVW